MRLGDPLFRPDEWHTWFAWFPVQTEDTREWVWLEHVWRRALDGESWQYEDML